MYRRQFLRLAGLGTAAVAGCSSAPESGATQSPGDPTATTESRSPTPSETDTATEAPARISAESMATYVSVKEGFAGASGTQDDPLASIYEAVRGAEPGETIHVAPGEYREEIHTQQGGNPGAPITLTGPRDAVVRPTFEDGSPRQGALLNIKHGHFHLRGLTFDGLADPGHEGEGDWYGGGIEALPEDEVYLEDLVIMPDAIGNSRKAMVSLIRVVGAEVGGFEVIGPAGVQHLHGDVDGHNGEIVYVGTAIDNIMSDWYPGDDVDRTRDVHVHHIDNSAGHPHAELVDAKPGTRNVLIEYCTDLGGSGRYILPGHEVTDEAAVGLRGRDGTLRWSVIENGHGQAVKVGSWNPFYQEDAFLEKAGEAYPEEALELDAGTDNAVYGNRFTGNAGLAVQFETDKNEDIIPEYGPEAQHHICGNEYNGRTHGDPDAACSGDLPVGDGIGHTGGSSTRTDEP